MCNIEAFVHPLSDVKATKIGTGTKIWQYCVILENATIGCDCNICSHCFIENDVIIGDRVTVKCGVQLWDGVFIEDDVFIGPNVTFTNDRYPQSKAEKWDRLATIVQRGAVIGANATVLPGVIVGCGAIVGAGSVVTRDVKPGSKVVGNPARPLLSKNQ